MENEDSLEILKEKYSDLQKKFNLPSFEELNKYFYIEKIDPDETELLAREIRRFIYEKLSSYFKVIEAIIHPSNPQAFTFSLIRSLTSENKEKLSKIYFEFSKKEIEILALEVEFSLEREIEFIKSSFKLWDEIKDDLIEVFSSLKLEEQKKNLSSKNYFG